MTIQCVPHFKRFSNTDFFPLPCYQRGASLSGRGPVECRVGPQFKHQDPLGSAQNPPRPETLTMLTPSKYENYFDLNLPPAFTGALTRSSPSLSCQHEEHSPTTPSQATPQSPATRLQLKPRHPLPLARPRSGTHGIHKVCTTSTRLSPYCSAVTRDCWVPVSGRVEIKWRPCPLDSTLTLTT